MTGCGIGVLLRMFWVLTVVVLRSFKGNKEEESVPTDTETVYYEGVVLFDDKEQLPEYSAPANAAGDFPDDKKAAPAPTAATDN